MLYDQLVKYAKQHTQVAVINRTLPWVGEDVHPDDGYWLSHYIRYEQGCSPDHGNSSSTDCDMDELYNHSTFADLILAALVGLVPALAAAASSTLRIDSLLPIDEAEKHHFAADNIWYQGHSLAVVWDPAGTIYNQGTGLSVFVDGELAANSPTFAPLEVDIPTTTTATY